MNFRQRIHNIASQDGIITVVAISKDSQPTWAGNDEYRELALAATRAQQVSPDPMIRVSAGRHAILASGDGDTVITVVFHKAHPVVKSVKRTIRQLLRRSQRERSRATTPQPVTTPPTPTAYRPRRDSWPAHSWG